MKKIIYLLMALYIYKNSIDAMIQNSEFQIHNHNQNLTGISYSYPNTFNTAVNILSEISWHDTTSKEIAEEIINLQNMGMNPDLAWEVVAKKSGRWVEPIERIQKGYSDICNQNQRITFPSKEILEQRMNMFGLKNDFFIFMYADQEYSLENVRPILFFEIFVLFDTYREQIRSIVDIGDKLIYILFKDNFDIKFCCKKWLKEIENECNSTRDQNFIKLVNQELLFKRLKLIGLKTGKNFLKQYLNKKISVDCLLKITFIDFLDFTWNELRIFRFPVEFVNKKRDEFFKLLLDIGLESTNQGNEEQLRVIREKIYDQYHSASEDFKRTRSEFHQLKSVFEKEKNKTY